MTLGLTGLSLSCAGSGIAKSEIRTRIRSSMETLLKRERKRIRVEPVFQQDGGWRVKLRISDAVFAGLAEQRIFRRLHKSNGPHNAVLIECEFSGRLPGGKLGLVLLGILLPLR